ncbi:DUF4179 domain-containing protein [Lysinibacillus parviboronicapiens]|uniref:DUF4179 domain-containing protein n=1 Tax=Lysinibacillus parviboronicapiens TaxID=436516 RepID=UPI000D35AD8C|nr:DUF4179 domain-containing protein [Lysinibacillus parviboronicapiens]
MLSSDYSLSEDQPKKKRVRKKWFVIALCIVVVSCVIITNLPVVASFLDKSKEPDFSVYKTFVGQTIENDFGRLTLNEVMMDDNQILLNATFEPVEDLDFDYQVFFIPQVLVNGQNFTVRNGGQTIAQTDSIYTIYNSVKMSELPQNEKLKLEIRYNDWNWEKPIDKPWVFKIEALQEQLLEDRIIFSVDKAITLNDGQVIKVEKVVSTPISTTIYFQSTQSLQESIAFNILSESGKTWRYDSSYPLNEEHTQWGIRFDALYLKDKMYELIPVETGDRDKELGPIIKIGEK